MSASIAVMLVDDHPIFRFGVKSLLETVESIKIVGEAESGSQALNLLEHVSPDVVLLDIQMPGADGVSIVKRILKAHPDLKIIMLTAFEDQSYLTQAMTAGAVGYLLKSGPPAQIADSIERAYRGEKIINPSQASQLLDDLKQITHEVELAKSGLTEREIELIGCLAAGLSHQEISEKMYISVSTIKRMVDKIISTLGVSNKTQAVAEIIRRGWI